VTSNRFRPPALLAKIAATVDIVSGGRLDFGIGAGSRPSHPLARREYDAHGLPFHDSAHAVGSLAEACTVIRRLWTEAEPFDFHGAYVHLTGAFCNPKPIQRPHPPILIGGRSAPVLRVVAAHADLWNIPGGDIDDAVSRSALLDRYCAEIGRDPASVTRSIVLPISAHSGSFCISPRKGALTGPARSRPARPPRYGDRPSQRGRQHRRAGRDRRTHTRTAHPQHRRPQRARWAAHRQNHRPPPRPPVGRGSASPPITLPNDSAVEYSDAGTPGNCCQ